MKKQFEQFLLDWQKDFQGWDFSYLSKSGRMQDFPLAWNYYNEIKSYCENAKSMLDMGTGGGEFLSSLDFLPEEVCATEGYAPNIPIAKKNLEPMGISVFAVDEDSCLPFPDKHFDLVINRHESYNEKEINRILKNEGIFITQQVSGLDSFILNLLLDSYDYPYANWTKQKASEQLQDNGFNIIKSKEDASRTRFYDVGAILYYLKAIPWQISDFNLENSKDRLFEIHKFINKVGFIDINSNRFLMIAQKE